MEKLSDFFSELKERISNPFILSYLIGWGIWNYEIPVTLIFYKFGELKNDGYKSYLDVIQKHSSTWHFFWLPLFSALAYTFLFPFIKNLISAFGAWITTWGNNWNLRLTKTMTVSSEKYLEYKIQYEEALDKISRYANNEQTFNSKVKELENEKSNLQVTFDETTKKYQEHLRGFDLQLKNQQDELNSWQIANSKSFLDGEWYLKIITPKTESSGRQTTESKEYNAVFSNGVITMTQTEQLITTIYITNIICNFVSLILFISDQPPGAVNGKHFYWIFSMAKKSTKTLRGHDGNGATIQLLNRITIIPPQDFENEK